MKDLKAQYHFEQFIWRVKAKVNELPKLDTYRQTASTEVYLKDNTWETISGMGLGEVVKLRELNLITDALQRFIKDAENDLIKLKKG